MSDPHNHTETDIIAVEEEIGDDDNQPGISQPVTQAEVEDILNSPGMTIEERQERLEELARQVGTRDVIDQGGEFDPLQQQISEALNMLAQGGHTYGTLEAAGLDPEARSDARSPDDLPDDDN